MCSDPLKEGTTEPTYFDQIPTPVEIGASRSHAFWLLRRIFRKVLWLALIFVGITIISFAVIHLAPGSPSDMETSLNPMADAGARQRLEKFYHLDKPIHIQYYMWFKRLVSLDFGNSMGKDSRPVIDKIMERLPLTLSMNAIALFLTFLIALPIGIKAAQIPGGAFDRTSTLVVYIGFAMPGFWLALLLLLTFAINFPILPISGLKSLNYDSLSFLGKIKDMALHLTMPIFIYTFGALAGVSRFMRSSMIDVLRQDYIRTARSKGASEKRVVRHHALRNALLPVITMLGLSIPGLIGGSVVIEQIFSLPGLGMLFYEGVMSRDYSLIMGNLVLASMLTLLGNLLADICYGLVDPRIRSGAKSSGGKS